MGIVTAFARAWRELARPSIMAVLFLPMLGAVLLWSVLAWLFWADWTRAAGALFAGTGVAVWLGLHGFMWVLQSAEIVIVVALLLAAMVITAMIVTELVAMPVIVAVVGRSYPTLAKSRGGTIGGSIANATAAILIFALLWIVAIPLWLTGIGAIVLPLLIAAYLNQRLFRYDALAEHASRSEYRAFLPRAKGRLYALGVLTALVYYVPLLNFIAPVIAGLAFTHFCLGELASMRADEKNAPHDSAAHRI